MNTPFDPEPVKASTPEDSAGVLGMRTRWLLGIITAVAGIVALTHQSLTVALASAHRDSALKAAHAMLIWPLPMTQPILAGVAAFVLLGIAVQTNGWRQVTARQSRLVLGFAVAAILGAGPNTTDLSHAGSRDAVTWDFALGWRRGGTPGRRLGV
ncbi:MAG TPA: hypothetical protein VEH31_09160 [Streptosporangiaceae bacterium]|nr:hypothetical protein [Streptosporangiaceae bacterium]